MTEQLIWSDLPFFSWSFPVSLYSQTFKTPAKDHFAHFWNSFYSSLLLMISSLDFLPVFQDGFLQTVWTCCCPPLCLCFGFCLPLQLSKFSEVTKTNILLTVCTPLKFFVRSPSFPPVFLYFILFLLIVLTYHSIFSPIYFLILIYSLLPPLPFPSFFESEKSLSCIRLFATLWSIQSMRFSRPEYWSG